MIWGLGEGFGIVAAGTIIGEILLFTYACPLNDLLARTDPLIMQRRQVLLQREATNEGEKQCILRLLRQGHTRRRLDYVRRLPSECVPAAL